MNAVGFCISHVWLPMLKCAELPLTKRRAMVMLRSPHLSMTEIALRIGYSNASSFERAFQRWTGQSPAEFRRAEAGSKAS